MLACVWEEGEWMERDMVWIWYAFETSSSIKIIGKVLLLNSQESRMIYIGSLFHYTNPDLISYKYQFFLSWHSSQKWICMSMHIKGYSILL